MVFAVDIHPRGTFGRIRADAGVYDEDLPVGDYVVRLTRLPTQCRVNGVAERRVTVSARGTTAVRFSVSCDRRGRFAYQDTDAIAGAEGELLWNDR
jgi:hypothetical protein